MSKAVAVEFCFQKLKLLNMFEECLYYFSKLKTEQNKTKQNLKKESWAMIDFPSLKGISIWIEHCFIIAYKQ